MRWFFRHARVRPGPCVSRVDDFLTLSPAPCRVAQPYSHGSRRPGRPTTPVPPAATKNKRNNSCHIKYTRARGGIRAYLCPHRSSPDAQPHASAFAHAPDQGKINRQTVDPGRRVSVRRHPATLPIPRKTGPCQRWRSRKRPSQAALAGTEQCACRAPRRGMVHDGVTARLGQKGVRAWQRQRQCWQATGTPSRRAHGRSPSRAPTGCFP